MREPDLLGKWLYGVAVRTARCARLRLSRRRRAEEAGSARQAATAPAAATADRILIDGEQAEALHREIDRLPGAFRLPVVLCYFEGLTLDEAAHRLRWPVGTLRSRLARAREKLRRGLTRRGLALPGAAPIAMLEPRSASASVSPLLCDSTTRAAMHLAARHAAGGALAAPAAALAQEVLRTMLVHKLKTAALSLMLLAAVAAGAGWLARPLVMGDEPRMKGPPSARPASTAATTPNDVNPARMTINGRVLDPQGKPIAGARVAVLADRKRQAGDIDGRHRGILMGTAAADADGRFALDVTAISTSPLEYLGLIAAAPGRALAAIDLKTDTARQEASIALPPEKPVEGRLVDVQGQPAAGIVVRVAKLSFKHEFQPYDANGGPVLWPSPATTDADGRFRVLGLGADAQATYEVEDPRYAHQAFSFQAGVQGEGKPRPGSTITLRPAQAVEVHVVHSDDGKPMAGARVSVQSFEGFVLTKDVAHARTDGQGRARVVGWPAGKYRIRIDPPEGEPYLHAWRDMKWPTAAVQQARRVQALARGGGTRPGDRGSGGHARGRRLGHLPPDDPRQPAASQPAVDRGRQQARRDVHHGRPPRAGASARRGPQFRICARRDQLRRDGNRHLPLVPAVRRRPRQPGHQGRRGDAPGRDPAAAGRDRHGPRRRARRQAGRRGASRSGGATRPTASTLPPGGVQRRPADDRGEGRPIRDPRLRPRPSRARSTSST